MLAQSIGPQISLNRLAEKRADREFMTMILQGPRARILALHEFSVPILPAEDRGQTAIRWLELEAVGRLSPALEFAFLGQDASGFYIFACNVSQSGALDGVEDVKALKPLVDVRSLAIQGVLAQEELLIAAQARALLHWHETNRYCGRCGAQTRMDDGGWKRVCSACAQQIFPRTDPVVIMLITRDGKCLLGNEQRFPPNLYSTLAGFVEAGDDIEHAVRREVLEEAGIPVGAVHYVASQPWPFPHSLMIGCWGEALSENISLEANELLDARWFTRQDISAMMNGTHAEGLVVPAPISLAHVLLDLFVKGEIGDARKALLLGDG